MYPNTNPPVDKVGQVVIHLPDDATFYGERSYLPVSLDLVKGSNAPSLLRADEQGIHYMARYEVFSALCRDGAQRTVDQTPLVGGAPVRPERYLGMWREAIASSISAETAAKEHGIRAVAVLRAPLAAMAGGLGRIRAQDDLHGLEYVPTPARKIRVNSKSGSHTLLGSSDDLWWHECKRVRQAQL